MLPTTTWNPRDRSIPRRASILAVWIVLVGAFFPAVTCATVHDFAQSYEVPDGTILQVDNYQGFVLVQGWDEARVLVTADHGRDGQVEVLESRSRLRVIAEARNDRGQKRGPGHVEFAIRVPRGMEVRVEGHHTDVELEDLEGNVEVEVLDGDIFVSGGRGRVVLYSVQGEVELHGGEGRIEIRAPNDDIELRNCTGTIEAESVNGDIRMENISATAVDAISTKGDIFFDGAFEPGGDYYFSSHQGDVTVGLPADADLQVSVVTYSGDFEHSLDIDVGRPERGKRVEFRVGDGSGQLRMESFSGDIQLFDPKRGWSKRG